MSVWADNNVLALRKMWRDGLTFLQIAKAMGVSRDSVAGKLLRLGLVGDMTRVEFSRRVAAGCTKAWVGDPERRKRQGEMLKRLWRDAKREGRNSIAR